jgi:DNA-binding NarL/FixJ family response regulator
VKKSKKTKLAASACVDHGLSRRQRQTLELAVRGLSGPQIAERLGLRTSTVNAHMAVIRRKLGFHNRAAKLGAALNTGPAGMSAPARPAYSPPRLEVCL